MAIDFEALLTNAQKRQLIEQRIQQFAAEAYQLTINRKTIETLESSEEQLAAVDKSLEVLESAINVHKEELSSIPAE